MGVGTLTREADRDDTVKTKIIKDIVHTFIRLPEDFIETIVDTPLVQRMRRIQQLSLAHQVYPGAVHTRFEHSLGVAYTMKMALDSIRQNLSEIVIPSLGDKGVDDDVGRGLRRFMERLEEELGKLEKEAVTAALLHDIGHIGLSHVAETGLNDRLLVYYSEYLGLVLPLLGRHEDLVIKIIDLLRADGVKVWYAGRRVDMDTVYRILSMAYTGEGRAACANGVQMERPRAGRLYLEQGMEFHGDDVRRIALCMIARLLDSNIDVDRADYILRDSIHTGNTSGIYDINRYYSVLTAVPKLHSQGPNSYKASVMLGILDKGISVVENMLLSRIYMYTDVYLHDVSMIYSAMVSRILAILYVAGMSLLHESLNGGEGATRAARILERHQYLDALARFVVATMTHKEVKDTPYKEIAMEYDSIDKLETLLTQLTDDHFYAMLASIYSGRANDLLEYITTLRRWGRESCLAVSLYAHGVMARMHASALISTGERTSRLIDSIESYEAQVDSTLKGRISPLVVFNWSKHRPYKDTATHRIYVFRRRQPLSPIELHHDERAMVTRLIKNEAYSKILIAFPKIPKNREPPASWETRKGKLHKYIEKPGVMKRIATPCGLSTGEAKDMIKVASSNAVDLADTLLTLI